MKEIPEYRDDVPPWNHSPRRLVSPLQPSPCCGTSRYIESPRNTAASSDRLSRVTSRVEISMLRRFLRHHLNALHVMAILVRWGIPRTWALAMARGWERVSRWWLYPTGR